MTFDPMSNAEATAEEPLDVESLYDSERIAINKVMAVLSEKIGQGMEGSAFMREVRERFAEIGFVVRCDFYRDENDPRPCDERPWLPTITPIGRTEKQGEFDHDKMGHEVRSNILGKNAQGNVQKVQVGQPGFEQRSSGLIVPK